MSNEPKPPAPDAVPLARSYLAGGNSPPVYEHTTVTMARAVLKLDAELERIRTACSLGRSGVEDWTPEDAVASVIRDRDHLSEVHERFRVAAIGPGFHEPPITTEDAVIGELTRLRAQLAEETEAADEAWKKRRLYFSEREAGKREEALTIERDAARAALDTSQAVVLQLSADLDKLKKELQLTRAGWLKSSSYNVDNRREADAEKLARIAAIRERDEARAELAKVKAAHADLKATVAAVSRSHGGGG